MSQTFTDRVVLVTGAGVGIGFGLSRAFGLAGASVALNDIDPDLAAEAADKINAELGTTRVFPYPYDVADPQAIQSAIDDIGSTLGPLDIVLANAGITDFGDFLEYTPERFDRVMQVNLRGTFFTAQAAAQQMIAAGTSNGRIICTSSVTGIAAYPQLAAYGMTKAAIRHLVSVLAVELGGHHITVNAIAPGATLTERTEASDPRYAAHWETLSPNGRVGSVDDIVNAALFLASPGARHVTGQTLVVDGGWTLTSPTPERFADFLDQQTKG